MTAIVLLNPAAGARAVGREEAGPRIETAFRAAGVGVTVELVHGRHIAVRARRAAESQADVVVAAGGDGTVRAVAGALAGGPKPLGVLPLGTWNHFARDLGLPLDLDAAVRVIAAGHTRAVDAAEVNGHTFVNNSSIGVYPVIVEEREALRLRTPGGKWLALVAALRAVVRRWPLLTLRVDMTGQEVRSVTPLLFVGNNCYEPALRELGKRARLDRGELCFHLVKSTRRFAMAWLALRSLFHRLTTDEQFETRCVPELWVESKRRRLRVALDGDLVTLRPPLHYRSRPGALRVFVPG
jgi:diacylglycerol kinase family enzyme